MFKVIMQYNERYLAQARGILIWDSTNMVIIEISCSRDEKDNRVFEPKRVEKRCLVSTLTPWIDGVHNTRPLDNKDLP